MRHTNIIAVIAASAAIAAAGCTHKYDEATATGRTRPITIRATQSGATRTAFDGAVTTWVENDALSVIIAPEGASETEAKPYMFTVTDPENGVFGNTAVLMSDAAYDFYAVYPYNPDKTTVRADTDDALFDVGAARQRQHGASAAHIAALDPLTGHTAAASSDEVSIPMHHTATVIRLQLHNATGDAIPGITSVTITAPEGRILAARHTIDLADGTITADARSASSTIEVEAEASGEILAGGEFPIWAAAAPFTVGSGESLGIVVTTSDGRRYRLDKRFDSAREFRAATIMSTQVELSPATEIREPMTLAIDFTDAACYPGGFPDDEADAATTDEYLFGGHTFRFLCPEEYYFHSGGPDKSYLAIDGIEKDSPADIVLPVVKGYALSAVRVTAHDTCKGRYCTISVTDSAGRLLGGTEETNTSSVLDHLYEPVGTDDSNEYRIHIGNKLDKKTYQFNLAALEVTYSPL